MKEFTLENHVRKVTKVLLIILCILSIPTTSALIFMPHKSNVMVAILIEPLIGAIIAAILYYIK